MKILYVIPFLLLGSCASTTNLSLVLGERSLDDSDIEEVDEQSYVGLEFLWGILPWGLGLEAGVGYSEDDGSVGPVDVDAALVEGYVGARKTFREDDMFRPYIGAGLAYLMTDITIDGGGLDFDDDEGTEAVYARAGLGWHFALFHVGIDYRYTTLGEFEFADEDVDIDSGMLSIFGGLSF